MTGAEHTLDELAARVERLETKIATVEEASASPEAVLDGEGFWALETLRSQTQGAGAVLFTGTVRLPTQEQADWQQRFDTDTLLKTDYWTFATDVLAALGQPVRLRLLREVLCGTRTVAELSSVEELGTSGQVYHHLRQLVAAGWLRSAARGRYEVPISRVVPLLVIIAAAQG